MSWKKNACSVLLWLLQAVTVVWVFACGVKKQYNQIWYMSALSVIGILLVAGILVLLMHKLTFLLAQKEFFRKKRENLLWESLWVVLVYTLAITFFAHGIEKIAGESVYYEAAKVVQGQTIPQVVHGAEYLYLQVLHMVFLVFGNKITAGILFQFVLQLLSFLCIYFGVRKLAGRLPALAAVTFLPWTVEQTLSLSPGILFFFLFAVCFLFIAWILASRHPVSYCVAGVLCGVLCYLDIWGSLLLVFVLCEAFAVRKPTDEEILLEQFEEITFAKQLFLMFVGAVSGIAAFAAAICADGFASGKNINNVLRAWGRLYDPSLPEFTDICSLGQNVQWMFPWLLLFLLIGIFSFFCRKGEENFRVWHLAFLWFAVCSASGVLAGAVEAEPIFVIVLLVLAALSIREMFALPAARLETEETQEPEVSVENIATNASGTADALRTEEAKPEHKRNYIENPLPLPKKHEKKIMDYSINASETDGFDFDVTENDDFDIS